MRSAKRYGNGLPLSAETAYMDLRIDLVEVRNSRKRLSEQEVV
jgi:hypothetical protein